MISASEWDALVVKTYGRPYCFQQQDGCKDRGVFRFTVPGDHRDDEMHDIIPEVVNHSTMGVKFKHWLERDPKQPLPDQEHDYQLNLWWHRNFYPDFQILANDIHSKGLLEAGDYTIDIDW